MHVESSAGERFELEKTFNRGGEAEIWSVRRDPHLVAKLYHHPTAEHEAKLATMIASPPNQSSAHPSVAWPLHLLYQKRRFVGYLMPRVGDSRPIFHFYNPARRSRLAAGYPWRYFLHRTAQNLAAAVELVHDRGHVIGDLNESNVLVNREALVTLVDCDSFQVQGAAATNSVINQLLGRPAPIATYRSMVGKAEFTPPELHGVDFKSIDRSPVHDNFALAVMIFQLLMEGHHPFAGVIKEETAEGQSSKQSIGRVDLYGIRQGLFPHARNCPVQPPPRAPKLMWLAPDLQAAFLRSFVEGYGEPDRRPTAKEWRVLLAQAESTLVACPAAEKHIYSNHLWRCPHCERSSVPALTEGAGQPQEAANGEASSLRMSIWPTLPAKFSAALPTTWQSYRTYAERGAAWSSARSIQLWRQLQQQYVLILAWLVALPEQLQQAHATVQQYATVWQRWTIGYLLGVPAGGAVALGLYSVAGGISGVPLVPIPFSREWVCALMIAGFAGTLGIMQVWALRTVILRWSYLRELWVGVAALTGALLGFIIAGQLGYLLPITGAVMSPTTAATASVSTAATVTSLLEQGSRLPIWSSMHLRLLGLTLFFGATLGFLQSLLLRQQIERADDGRVWTVANGIAWLLVLEGVLLGANVGSTWTVATWPLVERLPATMLNPQTGLWLGVFLGGSIGLLGASLVTGALLLWLLRGPRRSIFWPQVALQILQTRNFPFRFQQQVGLTGRRWGRALLLLMIIVLLVEGVLAVGWG